MDIGDFNLSIVDIHMVLSNWSLFSHQISSFRKGSLFEQSIIIGIITQQFVLLVVVLQNLIIDIFYTLNNLSGRFGYFFIDPLFWWASLW